MGREAQPLEAPVCPGRSAESPKQVQVSEVKMSEKSALRRITDPNKEVGC